MSKVNGLMSPSILVGLATDCEAKYMKMWANEYDIEPTLSMRLGSYVDALSQGEEVYQAYLAEHPEIVKKDGTPKADYVKAYEDWKDLTQRDEFFMSFLKGEKQKELFGEIGGVKFHGFPDFMDDEKIVDLKYPRNWDSKEMSWTKARYHHWRMALYREMARQMDGKERKCYLAVVTRQTPYDHAIVELEDFVLQEAEEEMTIYLPRVKALMEGSVEPVECGVCDYCRGKKILTAPIESELLGFTNAELEEVSR